MIGTSWNQALFMCTTIAQSVSVRDRECCGQESVGFFRHEPRRAWCRMASVVADSGTIQALTSLAMAAKQCLNLLPDIA